MSEQPTKRTKRFGRYEYDDVSATMILAALVAGAAILGVVAYNYQGSPQTADKAAMQSDGTLPPPSSRPTGTTGSNVPAASPSTQR